MIKANSIILDRIRGKKNILSSVRSRRINNLIMEESNKILREKINEDKYLEQYSGPYGYVRLQMEARENLVSRNEI